jgi:streptogramin lyase
MISLFSALSRYIRLPERVRGRKSPVRASAARRPRRVILRVEALEDRSVPTAISVAGATINEIGDVNAFVASGSGGLSGPRDLVLGPDGNVYVASTGTNSVIRYTATGQLLGTFVAPSSGGLNTPFGLAFGPDSNLYVGSEGTNAIYEYNGTTGAFLHTFVSAGSGGLNDPKSIVFGGDGNLYVSGHSSNSILRYQGPLGADPGMPLPAPGQPGATFVAAGSGALANPKELLFGPDGNLYVASGDPNHAVLRFDGNTGSFIDTYVAPGAGGLGSPTGLAFDQDARLYVADQNTNAIHRFNNQGQYLDDLVTSTASSLRVPVGIIFDAQGSLLISSRDTNTVGRYDRGVVVTLSAASPTPVSVDYATADGTATAPNDYTAQIGTVNFAPGETSRRILLVTHQEAPDGNETFSLQLSNPTGGATIAAGSAVVTIAEAAVSIGDASAIERSSTLKFLDRFISDGSGGLAADTRESTFGPDGNLYVATSGNNAIFRYDGVTGSFIDTFVSSGSGGLNGPVDLAFGPDGNLYVSSTIGDQVLRYDGSTGVFLGVVAGGLSNPLGITFGSDGSLYIANQATNQVLREDNSGLSVFVSAGSGGLSRPRKAVFGPDGNLYVASAGTGQVLRYDGQTGAFIDIFATTGSTMGPAWLAFGTDGYLYTTMRTTSSGFDTSIVRLNAVTGAFVDSFDLGRDGWSFNLGPGNVVYDSSNSAGGFVERFGASSLAAFTVSLDAASTSPVTVDYSTADGTAIAGTDYLAASGTLTFAPGATTQTILIQTLDDGMPDPSLTFTLNLSNALGATISRGQGVGTITDSESAADHLLFLQQPSDATAGQVFSPAVMVEIVDRFGNVLTNDNTDTVTLAIGTNPGGGTLSGTLTVTVSGGIATFSDPSIDLAGSGYTLAANSAALPTITSDGFAINPAAADHLLFLQQPTDTPAGQTISPVIVEVVDQFGNVVTNYSSTVTLSLNDNPMTGATLSGTLTVTVVNGVATFSDLSIDLAGAGYTLHATIGGGLPDIDSDPFNIT